jgi:CheY-like chemotaxis protein
MSTAEILFVDDERDILALGVTALREAGYSVQSAISGDVALILVEQGLHFDLLITDIIMPGFLDGYALARKVREHIPNLPIVYSTGFGKAASIGSDRAPVGQILLKPYRQHDLLRAVANAIAAAVH